MCKCDDLDKVSRNHASAVAAAAAAVLPEEAADKACKLSSAAAAAMTEEASGAVPAFEEFGCFLFLLSSAPLTDITSTTLPRSYLKVTLRPTRSPLGRCLLRSHTRTLIGSFVVESCTSTFTVAGSSPEARFVKDWTTPISTSDVEGCSALCELPLCASAF